MQAVPSFWEKKSKTTLIHILPQHCLPLVSIRCLFEHPEIPKGINCLTFGTMETQTIVKTKRVYQVIHSPLIP